MSGDYKAYQRARNWLTLLGLILTLVILAGGAILSNLFYEWSSRLFANRYTTLFLYFLLFSAYSTVVSFPLSFYSDFLLEQKFQLSSQTVSAWFLEWTKKQVLSFGIGSGLVLVLYWFLWNTGGAWWLYSWFGYVLFSIVLSKLFGVLIIPLFYKYSALEDQSLIERIKALGRRFDFPIQNVFALNLSKTTKKANAMFTGFGASRRVVLSDTLLQSFTPAEIETVVAHELGHAKHGDIWRHLGFLAASSFLSFWAAAQLLKPLSTPFRFDGAEDIRSFPLLCLIFFFLQLVLLPAGSAFSRALERRADQFALAATQLRTDFVSALRKLGEMNLADPKPHPAIEWILYDHPAIGKRIKMAEECRI